MSGRSHGWIDQSSLELLLETLPRQGAIAELGSGVGGDHFDPVADAAAQFRPYLGRERWGFDIEPEPDGGGVSVGVLASGTTRCFKGLLQCSSGDRVAPDFEVVHVVSAYWVGKTPQQEDVMAYEFECAAVFPGCTVKVIADTPEDTVDELARHAREAHTMAELPEDVTERALASLAATGQPSS